MTLISNSKYKLDEDSLKTIEDKLSDRNCVAEERVRLLCIYWAGKDKEINWISRVFMLKERRIYKYLEDYHQRNKKSTPGTGGGSKEHLTDEQARELKEHLDTNIYRNSQAVAKYVGERFGVNYTIYGITKWLIRNGYRYKRPKLIPNTVSIEKQKEFIETYNKLKVELRKNEEIWFMDGVHPNHQTQAVHGWIKRSQRAQLPSTGKQKRLHYMGAISLKDKRVDHFCQRYEKIDSDVVITFLTLLIASRGKKKLKVICDRGAYHTSNETREFIEKHKDRIELIYLPPRCPNLNVIERLWKIFRENVTYNYYYKHFKDFQHAVDTFFLKKIEQLQGVLVRRLTNNFHIIVPEFLSR